MLSWFRRDKVETENKSNNVPEAPTIKLTEETKVEQVKSTESVSYDFPQSEVVIKCEVDPFVADYFKHFPQPYREKAIERFSKRQGFNRFHIIRDFLMQQEVDSARRGIFLEDNREEKERKWGERRGKQVENRLEKVKEQKSTGLPTWHENLPLIKEIPFDEEHEDMGRKLLVTASYAIIGVACFYCFGRDIKMISKYRSMNISNSRIYSGILLNFSGGCIGEYLAVCRLMNTGFYDMTENDKSAFSKMLDSDKKIFEKAMDYLEEIDKSLSGKGKSKDP